MTRHKPLVVPDIQYGRESGQQRIDLFLPDDKHPRPTPVVLKIHGGGWRHKNKQDEWPAINQLILPLGLAAASLNHRTSDEIIWPAQLNDCRAAMSWIADHAADYDIDPNNMAAWGESSGGQLALLLGREANMRCVIAEAAPTDLLSLNADGAAVNHAREDSAVSVLLGGTAYKRVALAMRASPAYRVRRDMAATLLIHGTADTLIPCVQSERLHKLLSRVRVPSTLILIQGGRHARYPRREINHRIQLFLRKYLRNETGVKISSSAIYTDRDQFYDYSGRPASETLAIMTAWDGLRGNHGRLIKTCAPLCVGKSVLDVGCGLCHLWEAFGDGPKPIYIGIDNNPHVLAAARARFPELTLLETDVYNLTNLDTFDTVCGIGLYVLGPGKPRGVEQMLAHARECVLLTYFWDQKAQVPFGLRNVRHVKWEFIPHDVDRRIEIARIWKL